MQTGLEMREGSPLTVLAVQLGIWWTNRGRQGCLRCEATMAMNNGAVRGSGSFLGNGMVSFNGNGEGLSPDAMVLW